MAYNELKEVAFNPNWRQLIADVWDAPEASLKSEGKHRAELYTVAIRVPKFLGGYNYYRIFYIEKTMIKISADGSIYFEDLWEVTKAHKCSEGDYKRGCGFLGRYMPEGNYFYSSGFYLRGGSNSIVWDDGDVS